jgi:hypothetical protein
VTKKSTTHPMVSSTPRLDSLAARGTGPTCERIHLANGQGIAVRTLPGADSVREVFVSSGVRIPDTEAWKVEMQGLDAWLTVGRLVQRRCYRNVPVEAVRELIVRHGGEHADQGPGWSIPAPAPRADALAQLTDLRGRFEGGYSADDIRAVFGRIYDAGGPYLVCVWEYADDAGFGGASQFYFESFDGTLFEIRPDIYRWLSGQQETPGPVSAWMGAHVYEPEEFPVTDDFHNYARTDRSE